MLYKVASATNRAKLTFAQMIKVLPVTYIPLADIEKVLRLQNQLSRKVQKPY